MTQPPPENDPQGQGSGPQRGLPPYGHDPQQPYPYHPGAIPQFPGENDYQAPAKNNTNLILGLLLGPILGTILGAAFTFLIFFDALTSTAGTNRLAVAILAPFVLPIPLLFFRPTRPWGFGLLIGVAMGSVILAGSCVWILDGLSVE